MPPSMTATTTVRFGCLPASSSRCARSRLIPGKRSLLSSSCQFTAASRMAGATGGVVVGAGVVVVTGGRCGSGWGLGAVVADEQPAAKRVTKNRLLRFTECLALGLSTSEYTRKLSAALQRGQKGPLLRGHPAVQPTRDQARLLECGTVLRFTAVMPALEIGDHVIGRG